MTSAVKYSGWAVMTLLAVFLFYTTAEYLSFRTDINFLLVKQEELSSVVWMMSFYVHIITAMLVLLIGPFQFIPKLRNKNLSIHRKLGKIYVYGILIFAAPSGLVMAFYAEGGLWSTIGFLLMSFLWFFATLMAVRMAIAKRITEHKKWMFRSYALTFAAVSLRLMVMLFSIFIYDEQLIVVSTAWLSWAVNLALVELGILLFLRRSKSPSLKQTI